MNAYSYTQNAANPQAAMPAAGYRPQPVADGRTGLPAGRRTRLGGAGRGSGIAGRLAGLDPEVVRKSIAIIAAVLVLMFFAPVFQVVGIETAPSLLMLELGLVTGGMGSLLCLLMLVLPVLTLILALAGRHERAGRRALVPTAIHFALLLAILGMMSSIQDATNQAEEASGLYLSSFVDVGTGLTFIGMVYAAGIVAVIVLGILSIVGQRGARGTAELARGVAGQVAVVNGCTVAGGNVAASSVAAPSPMSPAVPSPAPIPAHFCRHCGNRVAEGQRFCAACGSRLR